LQGLTAPTAIKVVRRSQFLLPARGARARPPHGHVIGPETGMLAASTRCRYHRLFPPLGGVPQV